MTEKKNITERMMSTVISEGNGCFYKRKGELSRKDKSWNV